MLLTKTLIEKTGQHVGPHSTRTAVVVVVAAAVDQKPDVMENGVWQVWPHATLVPLAGGWSRPPRIVGTLAQGECIKEHS